MEMASCQYHCGALRALSKESGQEVRRGSRKNCADLMNGSWLESKKAKRRTVEKAGMMAAGHELIKPRGGSEKQKKRSVRKTMKYKKKKGALERSSTIFPWNSQRGQIDKLATRWEPTVHLPFSNSQKRSSFLVCGDRNVTGGSTGPRGSCSERCRAVLN